MKRAPLILAAIAVVAIPASAALVAIRGGGIIHNNPDPNFPMPNMIEANVVQGINEKQGLVLGEDLSIEDLEDIIGVVDLAQGTLVSSHLLAFDPTTTQTVSDILIEFDREVLAVITRDGTLFDTHGLFGLESLNYPGFVNLYGFEAGSETFSVDGNTVTFSGGARNPGDYFRVLTVPAPTSAAMLAIGGLAATRRRRS